MRLLKLKSINIKAGVCCFVKMYKICHAIVANIQECKPDRHFIFGGYLYKVCSHKMV